jgi:hypothetical protein
VKAAAVKAGKANNQSALLKAADFNPEDDPTSLRWRLGVIDHDQHRRDGKTSDELAELDRLAAQLREHAAALEIINDEEWRIRNRLIEHQAAYIAALEAKVAELTAMLDDAEGEAPGEPEIC